MTRTQRLVLTIAILAALVAIAMLGVILAGTLDVEGYHRVLIVTAVLFFLGAAVSWFGIRNPKRADEPVPAA